MKFFIFVILFVLIGIIIPVYFFDSGDKKLSLPNLSLPHLNLFSDTTPPKPEPSARVTTASRDVHSVVRLYYYNANKDRNNTNSDDAIAAVERPLPATKTPIKYTLDLLLSGKLTRQEKDTGFSTEFPHKGFLIRELKLENKILTIYIADPDNFSCGGSYRVEILKNQITRTAMQFPQVKKVIILPDTLFQP